MDGDGNQEDVPGDEAKQGTKKTLIAWSKQRSRTICNPPGSVLRATCIECVPECHLRHSWLNKIGLLRCLKLSKNISRVGSRHIDQTCI